MTDDRDPWSVEADAICFDARDFAVADAAELPEVCLDHVEAAQDDETFEVEFGEWLDWSLNRDPVGLLALEQSCDSDGVLLPWDMRGVRLWSAPAEAVSAVHDLSEYCARHVFVHLSHYVFWLVRAERARRRGAPVWTPALPLPPLKVEPTFFRPSRLVLRR